MASTTLGALAGLALGGFGRKPKVPSLAEIDPNTIQKDAIQGNIASFADIAKLAATVNVFNQDQLQMLIDRALPGAREQITKTIGSQLRGEVPEDVSRAITRYQAGRNVGALTRGSGFAAGSAARQLGLTSLDIIDRGLKSAESWLQRAQAPQLDASSMFFTPQQRLGFAERQQAIKFQRDMEAAGVAAAPEPWRAALTQGIDSDIARIQNAALSFGGMALGGGGGFGGGGPAMPSQSQQSRMMSEYWGF